MKRIGILTLSSSDNVGSLLQTVALQCYLQSTTEHHIEIINFTSLKSWLAYNIYPFQFDKNCLFLKQNFKQFQYAYYRFQFKTRYHKQWYFDKEEFKRFRVKYLSFSSKHYSSLHALTHEKFDYDIVICGSDQIWNVLMYDFDDAFFLPFANNARKVAYAPSLGSTNLTLHKKHPEKVRKWIQDLDYISVREEHGQDSIKAFTGVTAPVLVDPTLLMPITFWDDMAGDTPLVQSDYIFFYHYSYANRTINSFVQNFSKKLKLPVYVINLSRWAIRSHPSEYGFELCKRGGPSAFLNLMKYAKYVLVTSLHGSIFSSVFKKDFWFIDENGKAMSNQEARIGSMLKLLGHIDRLCDPTLPISDSFLTPIDYTVTNDYLEERRKLSIEFLEKALR